VEAGALGTRLTGATVFATELAFGTGLTRATVFATELALGTRLAGSAVFATELAFRTRFTGAAVFATEVAFGTRLTRAAVFATEVALGTGLTGCARCAGGVATVSTDMLSGELLGQVSRIADRANRGIAGLGGLGHSLGDSLAAELLRLGDFARLGGGGGISSDDGHRGKFSVGGLKLGVAQAGGGGTGRFGGVLGGGFCRIFFGLHLCFLVWGVRVDADGGRGRGFAD